MHLSQTCMLSCHVTWNPQPNSLSSAPGQAICSSPSALLRLPSSGINTLHRSTHPSANATTSHPNITTFADLLFAPTNLERTIRQRAVAQSAKMSGLDVEALLDSTASSKEQASKAPANGDSPQNGSRSERDRDRRSRDRSREGDRDRGHRRRDRSGGRYRTASTGRETPRSDAGSTKSRRRSRSRDSGRHSRRHRTDGDYYRGSNRARGGRSRSRSPHRYRPSGDDRRERERERDDRGYRRRDDERRGARQSTPRDASPTGDERDRRTVFVQQLAARLRTRELKEFFEKVGAVAEAQIVKDRVSNRSKGCVRHLRLSYQS